METPSTHTLPDEVLAQIFSHLSQGEILRGVLPVCRRWRDVAQSRVLSKRLVFCDRDVPTEEAVGLIEAIPNLQSLVLEYQPDTAQLLQAVGRRCRQLRQLEVTFGWMIDSPLVAALSSVFHSCSQHLTDLTLGQVHFVNGPQLCDTLRSDLPNLNRLAIMYCGWFNSAELEALLEGAHRMQEFCTSYACSDVDLRRLAQSWGPTLQVLKLRATHLTDAGLAVLAGCSQLRSLQLRDVTSCGAGLQQLALLPHLEHFDMSESHWVEPENIEGFFRESCSAGQLQKINLNSCPEVGDRTLTALASVCPRLEDLDVSYCQKVTAAGVRELLRGCRRLLRLGVWETHHSVAQILPEIPQLAPQLRWMVQY